MVKPKKALELDGRTGEGGGQLVRLACTLAAVTSQPIRITNVRGNRPGSRGGGLKAQHVTAIEWLAGATEAEVDGLAVGSRTLEFRPSVSPAATNLRDVEGQKKIRIESPSGASSTLLIFQVVFPFLLFAGGAAEEGEEEEEAMIELEIHGGTNVSFSLSYEYLDQVLLPTLQAKFGIAVERAVKKRSWSIGPQTGKGCVWFKFRHLAPGEKLRLLDDNDHEQQRRKLSAEKFKIENIDISILAPTSLHEPLQQALASILGDLFPDVDVIFVVVEDSGHDTRMYVLLVARSQTGSRWGRDFLYDRQRKNKSVETLASEIARKVCKDLYKEISLRGVVDEYLQDQLVVFQALAEGRTSFPRGNKVSKAEEEDEEEEDDVKTVKMDLDDLDLDEGGKDNTRMRMRMDRTHEPFGDGSTHTTTARWVAGELLPTVRWFNRGTVCEGAGISFPPSST